MHYTAEKYRDLAHEQHMQLSRILHKVSSANVSWFCLLNLHRRLLFDLSVGLSQMAVMLAKKEYSTAYHYAIAFTDMLLLRYRTFKKYYG